MMEREKTEIFCKKAVDMLLTASKICKILLLLLIVFGIVSAIVIYGRGGYGGVKLLSTWRDVVFVLVAFLFIVAFDKAARTINKKMWDMIRPGDPDKSPISKAVKFLVAKAVHNKKDGDRR